MQDMEIEEVGVVGGGAMGAGIIQTLLSAGCEVCFKEVTPQLVEQSLKNVEAVFQSLKKRGVVSEDEIERRMKAVKGSTDYAIFSDADLVIEAVPERMEIKGEVFRLLDQVSKPEAILASNTSSLSISALGAMTKRPHKVIGMHWFNPPHIMKLIEIVPGLETEYKTVEVLIEFCRRLAKLPIRVKECAGFLVNRLLGIYVNEALHLVQEGNPPHAIGLAVESLKIPMGPLKLGDMVGWDVIYHANATLYEEYGSRFAVPPLLAEIYAAKRWGAKTGQGFYRYEQGRVAGEVNAGTEVPESAVLRLISTMINEGVRCLDEGVASLENIDTAMKVGAGMPRGPLEWADEMGLDQLLACLISFREKHGERFLPSPLLKRKVAAGHLGKEKGVGFYRY
jgi:3-hydroxyacyl-CoA dehydrogenase